VASAFVKTKGPRKWRKCNLVLGDRLCGQRHGLAMNWVNRPRTSADEGISSFFRAVLIVCRVWSFFIDLSFLGEKLPWSFSGLDSCVLAYCGSAAPALLSIQSFYSYARGDCEAARSFFRAMHSVHLISVEK